MAEAYREIEPEDSDSDLEYSDALENELGNADLKSDEFSAVKKDEKIDSNDKFFDVEGAEEDVVAFVGLIQVPHQLAPVREGLFAEVALLLDPPPEQSLILKIGKRTEAFS